MMILVALQPMMRTMFWDDNPNPPFLFFLDVFGDGSSIDVTNSTRRGPVDGHNRSTIMAAPASVHIAQKFQSPLHKLGTHLICSDMAFDWRGLGAPRGADKLEF
jgi:hypothetical protein